MYYIFYVHIHYDITSCSDLLSCVLLFCTLELHWLDMCCCSYNNLIFFFFLVYMLYNKNKCGAHAMVIQIDTQDCSRGCPLLKHFKKKFWPVQKNYALPFLLYTTMSPRSYTCTTTRTCSISRVCVSCVQSLTSTDSYPGVHVTNKKININI